MANYKYNRKVDLAIDDLKTFIATYEALTTHYKAKDNELSRGGAESGEAINIVSLSDLVAVMNVENKIHDSILELIYTLLPEYNHYEVKE